MESSIKYSIIEKLVQADDEELLNRIKTLIESPCEYSEEHKQLLSESLEEYKINPEKTESWDTVKNAITEKLNYQF